MQQRQGGGRCTGSVCVGGGGRGQNGPEDRRRLGEVLLGGRLSVSLDRNSPLDPRPRPGGQPSRAGGLRPRRDTLSSVLRTSRPALIL